MTLKAAKAYQALFLIERHHPATTVTLRRRHGFSKHDNEWSVVIAHPSVPGETVLETYDACRTHRAAIRHRGDYGTAMGEDHDVAGY